MEPKFKIGEMVEVVDSNKGYFTYTQMANELGIEKIYGHAESVPDNAKCIVIGSKIHMTYPSVGLVYAIRNVQNGKAYLIDELGLKSLDNPPKEEKKLTHMHVFKAIRMGVLPVVNERAQNYWDEMNRIPSISGFLNIETGAKMTIQEAIEMVEGK